MSSEENSALTDAEKILETHGCRPTAMRILILRTLTGARRPLSAMEIESILDTADRSTITRTLALFVAHRLVHSIDDGSGSIRYEFCQSEDHHDEHDDRHPHFHCSRCGLTYCMADMELPPLRLPEGFTAETSNYIITGICPKCRR